MCDLGQGIYNDGIKAGRNEGIELGISKGRKEGILAGRNEGRNEERAILMKNLMHNMHLTEKEAMEVLGISSSNGANVVLNK